MFFNSFWNGHRNSHVSQENQAIKKSGTSGPVRRSRNDRSIKIQSLQPTTPFHPFERYDYSQVGAYSITICTYKHEFFFGEIENREMRLNAYGSIAKHQWEQLSEQFKEIELGEFVIMPNHIHGIVIIQNPHIKTEIEDKIVGAGPAPARSQSNIGQPQGFGQPQGLPLRRKTIGGVVGAYKSLVANECLKIFKSKNKIMGKLWQRNYYEHIIRDEKSYGDIAAYIINNPAQWELDELYSRDTV